MYERVLLAFFLFLFLPFQFFYGGLAEGKLVRVIDINLHM